MNANIFVGAKHFGSKSLAIAHKLCAEMLRPCQNEMHPLTTSTGKVRSAHFTNTGSADIRCQSI